MGMNLIARAHISINATGDKVWSALVDMIEGRPIIWKETWQSNPYEDKGEILKIKPKRLLQYSHFSPFSGQPDEPKNYDIVTIELSTSGNLTHISLAQDHNATEEERSNSEEIWGMMLESLKQYLEI